VWIANGWSMKPYETVHYEWADLQTVGLILQRSVLLTDECCDGLKVKLFEELKLERELFCN